MKNSLQFGVNNVPNTDKYKAGYRHNISSKDHNRNQEEILNDILDLYNKCNSIEKELNDSLEIALCENRYLNLKVSELEALIKNLESKTINSGNEKTLIINPNEIRTGRVSPASINLLSSDMTMQPNLSTSKIRIEDNTMGYIFVPDSLDVELSTIEEVGVLEVKDTDVKNAFNNLNNSIWLRKVITDETISDITTEMIITLPEDVVSTYDLNELIINPFPMNSFNISAIEYRVSNGKWTSIPGFSSHSRYRNSAITSCGNIRFNFKPIMANQIKITFNQNKFITEEGRRVFYIGCREIDIRNNRYDGRSNFFTFNIELPNSNEDYLLLNLETIYNNANQLSGEAVQFEYFYYDKDAVLHRIDERLPFVCPNNKIIVKGKVFNGKSTPNISSFKVSYRKV